MQDSIQINGNKVLSAVRDKGVYFSRDLLRVAGIMLGSFFLPPLQFVLLLNRGSKRKEKGK